MLGEPCLIRRGPPPHPLVGSRRCFLRKRRHQVKPVGRATHRIAFAGPWGAAAPTRGVPVPSVRSRRGGETDGAVRHPAEVLIDWERQSPISFVGRVSTTGRQVVQGWAMRRKPSWWP
jgi:hypothetical protein